MKNYIITASALSFVAAGALFVSQRDTTRPTHSTTTQTSDRATSNTSSTRTHAATDPQGHGEHREVCAHVVGDINSYAFDGEDSGSLSLAAFGLGSGTAKETEVRVTLRATLDTEVLETSEDVMVLLGRWRAFESSAIQEDARMRAPFLFQLGPDCQLLGFAYHKSLPLPYARTQQALLHDVAFRVPSTSEEAFGGTDTLGAYTSTVSVTLDARAQALTRAMESLEPWRTGLGALNQVDASTLDVTLAKRGWLERATLRARYSGQGITSRRTLEVERLTSTHTITDASRAQADYVWADLLPQELPLREGPVVTDADLRARDALRDVKLDDVMDRLVERVQGDSGLHTTWPELRTYLEAKPEKAAEVVGMLQDAELPAEATLSAYMALGNARTPEAKQALEGIMQDEQAPVFERVRAMFSLVDRDDVGDDLAFYLALKSAPLTNSRNEGEHVLARHSLLALGMMSGLKPDEASIRKLTERTVRSALASSTDGVMSSPAYGALANTGDPKLLSLVEGIADHPDFVTRMMASIVVRRMPPKQTAAFTYEWLKKEKDWRVKAKIYDVLEQQTFSARETIWASCAALSRSRWQMTTTCKTRSPWCFEAPLRLFRRGSR